MAKLNPKWIKIQKRCKENTGYYWGWETLIEKLIKNKNRNITIRPLPNFDRNTANYIKIEFLIDGKPSDIPSCDFRRTKYIENNIIWGVTKILLFVDRDFNSNKDYCTCGGPEKVVQLFTSTTIMCTDCKKDKR